MFSLKTKKMKCFQLKPNFLYGFLLLPFALMTGCANMNAKFDCPMKQGQHCESLDNVNAMVDRGEIGQQTISPYTTASCTTAPCGPLLVVSSNREGHDKPPLRHGETVMRIWIAPYEDTHNNYHQASTVYSIVKPGHWTGPPLQSVGQEDI